MSDVRAMFVEMKKAEAAEKKAREEFARGTGSITAVNNAVRKAKQSFAAYTDALLGQTTTVIEETTAILQRTCNRCGYTWWPRSTKRPSECPKCNSPYWDKPRVRTEWPKEKMARKRVQE